MNDYSFTQTAIDELYYHALVRNDHQRTLELVTAHLNCHSGAMLAVNPYQPSMWAEYCINPESSKAYQSDLGAKDPLIPVA